MIAITKECLLKIKQWRETYGPGSNVVLPAEEAEELARIALESLEAEAVADVVAWSSPNEERSCDIRMRRHDIKPGPLYTIPPAPVVHEISDEEMYKLAEECHAWIVCTGEGDYNSNGEEILEFGRRLLSRAALQSAPVSVPDERTAFETFMEKRFKDCIDRRLVKNGDGEYFAWDMQVAWIVWYGRSAMLQSADGNSQVIPDGWVACGERMPENGQKVLVFRPRAEESNDPPVKAAIYKGGREYYHGFDCYCEPTHWMPLPAAPQQEVK